MSVFCSLGSSTELRKQLRHESTIGSFHVETVTHIVSIIALMLPVRGFNNKTFEHVFFRGTATGFIQSNTDTFPKMGHLVAEDSKTVTAAQ